MAKELDYKKMWESLIKNRSGLDGIIVNDIVNALNDQGFTFDGEHIVPIEENKGNNGGISPKFKVGDWVVWDGFYHLIEEISSEGYICEKGKIAFEVEKDLHLWSIADAKDGDVLCCESGWTCIFKALDNHTNTFSSYCFMDSYKWFCNTGCEGHTLDKAFIKAYNGEIHPATKEQCDTLFAKMKEAGYEWDAEKKELKKIEQKYADKVESKFKVDDWVVYNRNDHSREILQVYDIRDGRYYFNDNVHLSWSIKECDEKSHLWTIQDAKDGDVLVDENGEMPFIFKECKYNHIYCYCGYTNLRDLFFGGFVDSEDEELHWLNLYHEQAYPATKEQRDLLFQKMHEAGYEWDADKKELKKIEQKPEYPLAHEKMETERWKEACKAACSDINYRSHYGLTETRDDYFVDGVHWADEHPKQKQWKPTKEQLLAIDTAINVVGKNTLSGDALIGLLEQLKAL